VLWEKSRGAPTRHAPAGLWFEMRSLCDEDSSGGVNAGLLWTGRRPGTRSFLKSLLIQWVKQIFNQQMSDSSVTDGGLSTSIQPENRIDLATMLTGLGLV